MQLKKWMIAFSALAISSTASASTSNLFHRIECEFEQGKKGDGVTCEVRLQHCLERADAGIESLQGCQVRVRCSDEFRLNDAKADVDVDLSAETLSIEAEQERGNVEYEAELFLEHLGEGEFDAELSTFVDGDLLRDFFGECEAVSHPRI